MATTTDTDALLAEMDAFLAECAATDARVVALLAQPVVIRSISGRLAALRTGIEALAVDTAVHQAEQAEIERQIEALEQAD